MSQVRVSIIVPVYNTEKYLRQCMDSILAQTIHDIEIICINDGSVDNSQSVLEEYACNDARIRLINKTNGGLVSVRKLGVSVAKGNYIGFVDSDDWIDPEMFERLCREAEKHDADLVSSSYWQEGAYSNISRDSVEAGVYDEQRMDDLRDHFILNLQRHDKGLSGSLCTKLFRTSMLKEIIPNIPSEIRVSEDKVTSLTFLLECKKAVILDEAYYHYRINQDSMFHADDPGYLLNYHYVYNYFRKLYGHKNFTKSMRVQAELYIVQFLIKGINTQMGFSFRNLMWIDPIWMNDPGLGKRVALYCKGELGKTYETHLANNTEKVFYGYLDKDKTYDETEFDSVVIAVKNKEVAHNKKQELMNNGIPDNKIFWFKQEEIFWKFADAMGIK